MLNLEAKDSVLDKHSMFDMRTAEEAKHLRPLIAEESCLQSFSDNPSDRSLHEENKKRSTRYQNTYKLDPDKKFPVGKVEAIAEEVLSDHLMDVEYQENLSRKLVKLMSDKILQAVRGLNCPRHKIVVLVNLGQLNGQGIRVGSRFLWQPQHDNFAEAIFEGRTFWCTATVFGVYQD